MRIILSIGLIFFITSCGDKKKHEAHTMNMKSTMSESENIVSLMHQPMMEGMFQKTDNPDVDFLANMIPHHQGAVISSEEYVSVSTNEKIKAFAEKIIADQKQEMAEFESLIAELSKKSLDYSKNNLEEFNNQASSIMDNMMTMMSSIAITENVDKDYLAAMSYHHQGAVEQSKHILTITEDEKIKEIAQRIISAQEKEIAEIKVFLAKMDK